MSQQPAENYFVISPALRSHFRVFWHQTTSQGIHSQFSLDFVSLKSKLEGYSRENWKRFPRKRTVNLDWKGN